jgi:hypothetical protein
MCGIFTSGSAGCSFPLLVPGEGGSRLQGLQQTEHKNAMGEYYYAGGVRDRDKSLNARDDQGEGTLSPPCLSP